MYVCVCSVNQLVVCCLGERGFTVKRKIPSIRSKEVTYRLCRSLKDCLCVSPTLTTIELQGIPLRDRDVAVLAKVCTVLHRCVGKMLTLGHMNVNFMPHWPQQDGH